MTKREITVSEKTFDQLNNAAKSCNLTIEEFLLEFAIALQENRDFRVREAMNYVLEKNHELHKRLA